MDKTTLTQKLQEVYTEHRFNGYTATVVPIQSKSSYFGKIQHLSIVRNDGKKIKGWKELFAIKQRLFPDKTAIEVYPPKSKLIDNANVYHLWVLNDDLPFGLHNLTELGVE